MKNNRLPLFLLFALVAAAIIWRIANPPAPALPGPVGTFPTWKSIATLGDLAAQSTNPSGTIWAGAWNQTMPEGKARSAARLIDFEGYSAKSAALPSNATAEYLSWADDNTVRVLCARPDGNGQVVNIDGATGEKKQVVTLSKPVKQVIAWPATSDKLAAVIDENDKSVDMGVISESSKDLVGKQITFELPKDGALEAGGGVALDGSSFVFSISDPAAKDGRAFYTADTAAGTVKKAFELGDVPGRIEGIWPSEAGVLLVCNVKDKLEVVVYDPGTGKLSEMPNGAGDLAKWPGAPKTIALTTYDGGFEFNLATGKTKTLLDMSKRDSETDKHWRDFLRGSRIYKLKNGDFVTVTETSGAMDIRELKPDGGMYRAFLSRM